MAVLSRDELELMGFAATGDDVRLSTRASICGAPRIALGSHVRIDDFCVLSAGMGGIRERSRELLALEQRFRAGWAG